MAWFFAFFFVSGFCSVLYELIWLRLSMAQFGVTTALTSMVLSVFMAGLGVGSWLAGKFIRRHQDRIVFPLRLYALLELLIGLSALAVPAQLVSFRIRCLWMLSSPCVRAHRRFATIVRSMNIFCCAHPSIG